MDKWNLLTVFIIDQFSSSALPGGISDSPWSTKWPLSLIPVWKNRREAMGEYFCSSVEKTGLNREGCLDLRIFRLCHIWSVKTCFSRFFFFSWKELSILFFWGRDKHQSPREMFFFFHGKIKKQIVILFFFCFVFLQLIFWFCLLISCLQENVHRRPELADKRRGLTRIL